MFIRMYFNIIHNIQVHKINANYEKMKYRENNLFCDSCLDLLLR